MCVTSEKCFFSAVNSVFVCVCIHVHRLQDPSTGICLEVFTDQPCVQLYMGGYLDGSLTGKDGKPIEQFHGVCLETQKHPDAVNKV